MQSKERKTEAMVMQTLLEKAQPVNVFCMMKKSCFLSFHSYNVLENFGERKKNVGIVSNFMFSKLSRK